MNSGIFLINKDKGLSSNKAIQKIKRRLDIKKIGHFGTLDPLASGTLRIALGTATKLIRYIENVNKTYIFTINWGFKTETGDSEGEIIGKLLMG